MTCCGIFTRARRKRAPAALGSARTSATRETTFEDLPRDIKRQILGEVNLPDPVDVATSETTFEDLPRDIKRQILGEVNLPDPVDVARVRAVSRSMRDAVDDTGREIDELCHSMTAALRGYLGSLQIQVRRGCLYKGVVCRYAALGGQLLALKWARENGCPWDKWTCASAALGGHLEVLRWARENGCPE